MICRTNRRRSFSASSCADGVGQHFVLEAGGELVVLVLGLGEIAEQLADGRVGRAGQSLTVEARRGALHVVSALARRFEAERLHLPNRLLRNIAADVLAAHERDMVAEFRHEEIDEPAAVRRSPRPPSRRTLWRWPGSLRAGRRRNRRRCARSSSSLLMARARISRSDRSSKFRMACPARPHLECF